MMMPGVFFFEGFFINQQKRKPLGVRSSA